MQTIEEIRRDWIEALIARFGSIAALNEAVGRDRTDATFSQLRNQSPDSKTGRPRTMGSDMARDTERALKLEPGTLDHPPPGRQTPMREAAEPLAAYGPTVKPLTTEPPLHRELFALIDRMSDRGLVLLIDQAEQIAERHPRALENKAA